MILRTIRLYFGLESRLASFVADSLFSSSLTLFSQLENPGVRNQHNADGETGELTVRGPSAAEGYWNQRDKSRRTFRGEWTHTGDTYIRDADGYYRYCGRSDDMMKVNGRYVSPAEVEAALIAHEGVLEAAVVGAPDADGLIKPKAFVVVKPGTRADNDLAQALEHHAKATLAPFKCPRWIAFLDELPKTATGKIQRFKLREAAS